MLKIFHIQKKRPFPSLSPPDQHLSSWEEEKNVKFVLNFGVHAIQFGSANVY